MSRRLAALAVLIFALTAAACAARRQPLPLITPTFSHMRSDHPVALTTPADAHRMASVHAPLTGP